MIRIGEDTPCTLEYTVGTRYHEPVYTCSYLLNYTVIDTWWICHFRRPSLTSIRVVVTPRRVPHHYDYPLLTNHMDWWCLRDRNISYAEAGHLLWLHWKPATHAPHAPTRKLLRVERLRTWEMEPGDMFECNGTVWAWGSDFSCLDILPTGWPALVHCHGPDAVLIVLGIILAFIFLYANLIAVYNAYLYMRRSSKEYVKRKTKKNRKIVPFVKKDTHRPYINMPDMKILEVRGLLVKGESSDFPTSYFEYDRF